MNVLHRTLRAVLVVLAVLSAGMAFAAEGSGPGTSMQRIDLGQYAFPVYANHDLKGDLSGIEQIVFVFHGLQRNGDDYFSAAEKLAEAAQVDAAKTLIIAPNFFDVVDRAKRADLDGLPLWKETGWMEGDAAVAGPAVSSFTVVDDLLTRLVNHERLPHLRRIVIAGHSGGGQLVDRYAVLNHADENVRAAGIDLSYVIANPSSYLYFTPNRPSGSGFSPYSLSVCPDYDHYRYGMQDMVPYAGNTKSTEAFQAFAARNVTFLWGTDDTDPNQRVLDKSCGAEAQGPSRYVRGHSYWSYEHLLDQGGKIVQHHAFDVVGVGHNQSQMLGSNCGAALLFGVQSPLPDSARCVAVDAPR